MICARQSVAVKKTSHPAVPGSSLRLGSWFLGSNAGQLKRWPRSSWQHAREDGSASRTHHLLRAGASESHGNTGASESMGHQDPQQSGRVNQLRLVGYTQESCSTAHVARAVFAPAESIWGIRVGVTISSIFAILMSLTSQKVIGIRLVLSLDDHCQSCRTHNH